jgi:hypothetical protein
MAPQPFQAKDSTMTLENTRAPTIASVLLAAALTLTATSSHATLILTVSDGTTTTSISDGGAGDFSALEGGVVFVGGVGTWIINVVSGFSKPLIGTPYVDEMHLASVNVTGANAGTLTVSLEDDGFTKLDANWISAIGGVSAGSISASTFIDGIEVASFATGAGAFANTQSGQISALGPYAIKLVATIAHAGGYQSSSFDYVVKVPEPGTLSLLGAGLFGLALLRRRRPA